MVVPQKMKSFELSFDDMLRLRWRPDAWQVVMASKVFFARVSARA